MGNVDLLIRQGKVVVPLIYDRIERFSDEFSEVHINRKFGVINKVGKLINQPNI